MTRPCYSTDAASVFVSQLKL